MNTKHVADVLRGHAKNRTANRRLVRKIKKRGCWLCRKVPADLRELEFHHMNSKNKLRKIAQMLRRSMAALVTEIRKCLLLCRECHEKHHRAKPAALVSAGGVS